MARRSDRLRVLLAGETAGRLDKDRSGKLRFSYDGDYWGPDLSVAFPRTQGERWEGEPVHAWFAGVLPDSDRVREQMAKDCGCHKDSVFRLLAHYGLDLPGAVQLVSPDNEELLANADSSYREMTESEIASRLEELVRADAEERMGGAPPVSWMRASEHWSLDGQQSKLALMEADGVWYEALGAAATNVIVKPGVVSYDHQALDECVCLRLARRVGLNASEAELRSFEGTQAIVSRRYDRVTHVSPDGFWVARLHQEDCCQALGIRPENKYPGNGGPTSGDIVSLLDALGGEHSYDFVDALLFNYLIGATDAHGKNYSLIHDVGSHVLLAPLYDVASMLPYVGRGVYRTAMAIGRENRLGYLRRTSLERFAQVHGFDVAYLRDRLLQLADRIVEELPRALGDFADVEGIDELASTLVPRVGQLCELAVANVGRSGGHMVPLRSWRPPA